MARRRAPSTPQTVELDQLLHDAGTPLTPAQVAAYFRHGEFPDEQYEVAAIKRHLLTDKHRQVMTHYDLSIEQMLNGRVEGEVPQAASYSIYHDWNRQLGYYQFGGEGNRHGQPYPNYDAERRANSDMLWELVVTNVGGGWTVKDDETGQVCENRTVGLSTRVPSKWFVLAIPEFDFWVRLADLSPNAMNHARLRRERSQREYAARIARGGI
jgi:hypothetical protein